MQTTCKYFSSYSLHEYVGEASQSPSQRVIMTTFSKHVRLVLDLFIMMNNWEKAEFVKQLQCDKKSKTEKCDSTKNTWRESEDFYRDRSMTRLRSSESIQFCIFLLWICYKHRGLAGGVPLLFLTLHLPLPLSDSLKVLWHGLRPNARLI